MENILARGGKRDATKLTKKAVYIVANRVADGGEGSKRRRKMRFWPGLTAQLGSAVRHSCTALETYPQAAHAKPQQNKQ